MTCKRVDRGPETILRIEGTLDAVQAPALRPVIAALIAERRPRITIDLSSLRLIDSSGVGALVSLYKQQRDAGGEVFAIGVCGQPLAIFQLLRLDAYFGPTEPRRLDTQLALHA